MINYKKGKIILDQVAEDLHTYDDQGLIDYSKLYKVLRTCNSTLGLKLNPEKTEMLTVSNFKTRLPDDFVSLNFSYLCTTKTINVTPPSGFHVEYKNMYEWKRKTTCLWEKECKQVIYQKCDEQWQEFSNLHLVRLTEKSFKRCWGSCPNFHSRSGMSIDIGDDNIITCSFECGELYLNYVGSMEDENEDLLVLDHPLAEPYYEAAVTHHILKSVFRNKLDDVQGIYNDAIRDLARARLAAELFVNMPEYNEVRDSIQANRVKLHAKYFNPIE